MATIYDADGNELSGLDKGLLSLLGSCGNLTYLERKTLKELLMPQYLDIEMAMGHPANDRLRELTAMIKESTRIRVNKQKFGRKVKPNKR